MGKKNGRLSKVKSFLENNRLSKSNCSNEEKEKNPLTKKDIVILVGIVAFVAFAVVILIWFIFSLSSDSKIEIEGPDEIVITYGDEIPKSEFSIITKKGPLDGKEGSISKYDTEFIGTQAVTFSYKGVDKKFKLTIKPKPLGSFSIAPENNQIMWSEDKRVKEYKIYVDGVIVATTKNNFFVLEDKSIPVGEFIIKVEAVGINEKYENSISEEEIMEKLAMPSEIKYKDGKILWNAVTESQQIWYEVWVNEDCKQTKINTNEIEFPLIDGENEIKIIAKSSDSNVVWSNATETTFQKLSPVSNIRCSKEGILWDSTEENCTYLITVDGQEYQSLTPSYDYKLEIGKIYSISVQAVSNGNENILASEIVTKNIQYRKLDKPEPVVKQGSSDTDYVVEFSPIENATNYEIQVTKYTGEESTTISYSVEKPKQEFTIDNQVTEIVVEVIAMDKTGAYADSDIAVKQVEVAHGKLEQPKVTISKGNYKNSYIVEYTEVENADKYKIEVTYITKKGSYSEEHTIERTKRELEVPEDVISLEVRVTAVNASGVHENSDTVVVKKEVK